MHSLVVTLAQHHETPLVSTTVALELDLPFEQLIERAPQSQILSFVRGGSGIIGFGESLRLTARGPNRIAELAEAWRNLVGRSSISNSLAWPGTGLVAFGSIAFADESETESILIVPKLLLGSHDGNAWLTENLAHDGTSIAEKWQEIFTPLVRAPETHDVVLQAGQISSEQFAANVETALKTFENGELQKVVLARDVVAQLPSSFDLKRVLNNLNDRYQTCWIYSVDGTIGASPELLVRVSHGQVSARVLAGTAGRGTDPGIDRAIAAALADSAKNVAEHEFAVKSLVDALQPFCSHVDADSKPFSLALPNLWHLASDVHGVLKTGASSLDIAAALHPTAAVAGTPRKLALDFIARVEGVDRGRYAAPVGWISADGDGEWAIALRGGQVSTQADAEGQNPRVSLRAFAGCGVVAGSTAAAELAETRLKFAPIRDALG